MQEVVRGRMVDESVVSVVLGFVNPHVISEAEGSAEVRRFLGRCTSVCVDGVGTSLALRMRGVVVERTPAHRLLENLFDQNLLRGRALVFGIEDDHLPAAVDVIERRAPLLTVVSSLHGFSSDREVCTELAANDRIDIVLIGAGSPRSEWIANRAIDAFPEALVFACGAGSLLAMAGERQNAPEVVNRLGLDWLYRFVREPHTRRRYTLGAVSYAKALLRPNHPVDTPFLGVTR